MLGLLLRSPHLRATSSGSVSLNSPFEPSHAMHEELDESERSSSRNCQSWTWPPPTAPDPPPPAEPIREHVRCRRPNLSKVTHRNVRVKMCNLRAGRFLKNDPPTLPHPLALPLCYHIFLISRSHLYAFWFYEFVSAYKKCVRKNICLN